jgi:phosphoglycolate phosphatase-like HAD superfamily hydrolase
MSGDPERESCSRGRAPPGSPSRSCRTSRSRSSRRSSTNASGTRSLFAAVRGPENSRAVKPDRHALLDVVVACGAVPGESCFVGDSVVDFATGHSAGVFTIGVRGGYRAEGEPGPDLWLDDPPAVARWLALRLGGELRFGGER